MQRSPSRVHRFFSVAAIAAAVVASVDGRQMHAGIDYHRYLTERNETRQELDDWKTNFGDMAKKNGWMPPSTSNSEERSSDDEEEDHLQRFFMTKHNISAIQALNPNANFSTNTPFTLLTNEEFAAYVGKAYRAFNGSVGSSSSTRRLRSWHKSSSTKTKFSSGSPSTPKTTTSTSSGSAQTSVLGGTANAYSTSVKSVTTTGTDGKSSTTTTTTTSSGPGTESTTVTTSSGAGTNTASSGTSTASNFGFGSSWQWGNGFNFGGFGRNDFMPQTVKPAGSDSSSTATSAPSTPSSTTTSAPSTPTPTTATPTTAAPTTAAPTPTPTTAAPTPTLTTATPSSTSSTKSSASTTTVTATDTTSSSDEVDWTDSSCVSPIQSQGSCGDCWAFSTAAAIESGQCIKGGKSSLTKYSEQQLTSCDTQNYGCSGGAPVYAMEYVQENGLCTEDDYPYTSSEGTAASCTTSCSAVDTGITGYETVDGASDLATVVAQQPVIVAVASGNNAWKQYTGGVISSCDTSDLDHAVVVVGYTASEWKIRNSWGEDWGESGYIRLERTSDSSGTCGMYGDMSYPTF